MITHDIQQGSDAWLALRERHYTASDAPVMMGLHPTRKRTDLIREKALGAKKEYDTYTQAIFEKGHESERKTRPIIEDFLDCDLFPITVSASVEGLALLASLDGTDMGNTLIWENKVYNKEYAELVRQGIVPDAHWPQLEHQMLVTGIDRVLFTVSDGENRIEKTWYVSLPERRQKIIAGWKQFQIDVAEYQHVEIAPAAVGRAPDQLPALHIEVTGMVTASNLDAFKAHALAVFDGIKTDLNSDEDFASAERTVRWCKDIEDRLDAAKQHALGQTSSIDDLFRTIDSIKEEARQKRLTLDRAVKARKESIRVQLVQEVADRFEAHVKQLNGRIGGQWMPAIKPNFGESIKGKKTITSCREALDAALANSKIEASAIADRIEINIKTLQEHVGWNDWGLVPDFAQVCVKPAEDFARLIAERKKEEKTRIAAAIAAKEAAELARQQAAAAAEQARQDAKVTAPEPERELARELAQAAVKHEEARPSRTAIKLRTQAALAMEGLSEADLMRVIEFIAGLVAQQKKAA